MVRNIDVYTEPHRTASMAMASHNCKINCKEIFNIHGRTDFFKKKKLALLNEEKKKLNSVIKRGIHI